MSVWDCPGCEGGFPEPIMWQGSYVCPWCYEELGKHHSHGDKEIESVIEPNGPFAVTDSAKDCEPDNGILSMFR